MRFLDGITNVFNQLVNRRSAQGQNRISRSQISYDEMRAIYLTGIGNKIVRIKSGYALNDTLEFGDDDQKEQFKKLHKHIKKASRFMLAFGRGVIVLHKKGDRLSDPLTAKDDLIMQTFSGDMVTVGDVGRDLSSPRYMKPLSYNIRGESIHHTRVIDFTYVEPSEFDAPAYMYGGVSEFELIYPQIVNDAIIERASASLVERSSNWVYKIKGFKDSMMAKKDDDVVAYFSRVEDMRGIYGAVMLDAEDSAESISQSLTNLAETDQISLRRLAMVTGIPLAVLVGENVKGLNSTGDNEDKMFQDMIETLQSDYLVDPIQQLCTIFDIEANFKENQGGTAGSRMDFETKVILNARQLFDMGGDHDKYLEKYNIQEPAQWDDIFPDVQGEVKASEPISQEIDPSKSLNGAQVTALMEVITRLGLGEISRGTAAKIISTAFPLTVNEAEDLLADVSEGEAVEPQTQPEVR